MTNWTSGTSFHPGDRVCCHGLILDVSGIVTHWGSMMTNGAEETVEVGCPYDKNLDEWWNVDEVDLVSRKQARKIV